METRCASARCLTALLLPLVAACAATPAPPSPGTAIVWGYLSLVPREGVEPHARNGGAYADRTLRDARFVDYSKPGFAVVYAAARPPEGDATEVVIRERRRGVQLIPSHTAVAFGGVIRIRNGDSRSHVLSDPVAGRMVRIDSGAHIEIPASGSATHALFLLDDPNAKATVFIAPGPYSVVSEQGRFELRDLPPGPLELHGWHPRFPAVTRKLRVTADSIARFDLEVGVANLGKPLDAHH